MVDGKVGRFAGIVSGASSKQKQRFELTHHDGRSRCCAEKRLPKFIESNRTFPIATNPQCLDANTQDGAKIERVSGLLVLETGNALPEKSHDKHTKLDIVC